MKRFPLTSALIGLTVLLTACPQPQPPTPPGPAPETSQRDGAKVTGQLKDYTMGAAVLAAYDNLSEDFIATGPLAADGAFNLTLPNPAPAASQFIMAPQAGCAANPTVTPASSKIAVIGLYGVIQGSDLIGAVQEVVSQGEVSGLNHAVALRLYASTNTTITGKLDCGSGASTFNLNLKAGWNIVQEKITAVSNGNITGLDYSIVPASTVMTPIFEKVKAPEVPFTATVQNAFVTVQRGEAFDLITHLTAPDGLTGPVTVSLVNPPPGFVLETPTVPLASASATTAQSLNSGFRASLAARDRMAALEAEHTTGASLRPQAVNSTSTVRIRTTSDAPRSTMAPTGLTLRFTLGERTSDVQVQVQVNAPGVAVELRDGYYSTQGVTLGAGDTKELTAFITAQHGLTGPVDLSLGASASGITGAGHLDNLGTGSSTSFSVTVPASLTPGTYPVDVVATHAGGTEVVSRLNVVVAAPTARITAQSVTVYGGESVLLPVSIQGEYGFTGPITVTATDLPAGVTVTPVTTNYTKNAAAAVNLTLTGDAALTARSGLAFKVRVTGANGSGESGATLNLAPRRFSLGKVNVPRVTTAAGTGFWCIQNPTGQYGNYQMVRFDGQQETTEVALPGFTSEPLLMAGPDETAWVVSSSQIARYAAGSLTSWTVSGGTATAGVVDAQGTLFTTQFSTVTRFNAANGTVQEIYKSSGYGSLGVISTSADGTRVYVYDGNAQALKIIDTTTLQVETQALAGLQFVTAVRTDATGRLWVFGTKQGGIYGGVLARINADGTTSLFTPPAELGGDPSLRVFDFDAQGRLWIATQQSSNVVSFDPARGTFNTPLNFTTASPHMLRMAVEATGGIWVVWEELNGAGAFTTLLK